MDKSITPPPSVSVLMTCYNRAGFLPAAIASVMQQAFADFELIICDDASTDGSVDIANSWARRDSRIRVSSNTSRIGDYPNRNRAAGLARGEFLKYLDSDDLMYPHCLEVMVGCMRQEPRAGIGISLLRRHTGGPAPMLLDPRMSYQREFLGSGLFSGGPGAAILRRDTFARLGGFEDAGNASDDLFWLRACSQVSVLLLPADLTWYRIHPDRASSDPGASDDYFVVPRAAWAALESQACPLDRDETRRAKNMVVARLAKGLLRDLRRKKVGRARRRLAASGISPAAFLAHLRPLRLDALAGTPLDENRGYIDPPWLRLEEGD